MIRKCYENYIYEGTEMRNKKFPILMLSLAFLLMLPFAAQAAVITACTLDREVYHGGEVGHITVTVHNDEDDVIRVTEITATIDYYYSDGTTYLQTFFSNATLPAEIPRGESSMFNVSFSLPTNIASGYVDVFVRVRTELWNASSQRWYMSDNPIYQLLLFIESPYKQQFEQQQIINEQLQQQLEEQQSINAQLQDQLEEQQSISEQLREQLSELKTLNNSTTIMMYVLGATTILFAVMTIFLMILSRRPKIIPQPPA